MEAAIAQGHVGAWSAEARTEANQTLRRSGGQQLGIRAENVFYNTTWRSRGIARVFGFLQSLPAGFSLLSLAVLPWVLMGFEQQSRSFYSLSVYFWFAGIALPILFALVGAYLTLFAHWYALNNQNNDSRNNTDKQRKTHYNLPSGPCSVAIILHTPFFFPHPHSLSFPLFILLLLGFAQHMQLHPSVLVRIASQGRPRSLVSTS